jgi:UDP:flavonoid glycosyltransferase YjiC (YdhE family)
MLGERIYFDHPRVQLLRDYPNSMYFNAFDASVQAGGYNSFHEMRTFGIPTLFYPNMKTGMDDQLARCAVAKSEGWGIVLGHREKKSIERAVGDLLALEKVLQGAEAVNGAEQLADIIINKME